VKPVTHIFIVTPFLNYARLSKRNLQKIFKNTKVSDIISPLKNPGSSIKKEQAITVCDFLLLYS
jgi:hypothetical protein